jgi:hypothetical protein
VIEGLRRIAPTTAVKGNIDAGEWAKDYPDTELVVLERDSVGVNRKIGIPAVVYF